MSRRSRYVIGGNTPRAYDRLSDDVVAVRPGSAWRSPNSATRYDSFGDYCDAERIERDRRAALGLAERSRKPRKSGKRRITRAEAARRAERDARELRMLDRPDVNKP